MAMIHLGGELKSEDSSSDDEYLSILKIKVVDDESGLNVDDEVMTPMLVSVKVEEVEEEPLNLVSKKNNKEKSSLMKKHKKLKTDLKPVKQFTCEDCDATFDTMQDKKNHALTHQVETRHKCEFCGKCFKKAFGLKLHKQVHMDKTEKCPLCDATFNLTLSLGRHMKTHRRTEQCDHCPAAFHTKHQLNQHMQTHRVVNKDTNKSHINLSIPDRSRSIDIKAETFSDDSSEQLDSSSLNLSQYLVSNLKDLPHTTQCAIVNKLHKGRPVQDICNIYNATPELVNQLWEEREKYTVLKKAGKRTTKYMNNILDKKLIEWFKAQKNDGVQVSGKMLQDVAEVYAKESGFLAFNGSRKWLDRFKKKYNIMFRGGNQKKRDYQQINSKWKNLFLNEQWRDVKVGVADEDIYTADEIGFFFNPSKGRVKKLGGKKFIQGHTKDRLSIFVCANIPGTDKKNLLVCGSDDPLIHSYRNPETLPVTYIRHTQAHFTTAMFEDYVKYWNKELAFNKRTAILILDRATIHSKLQLSHLKLVFVPWKASSGLIPIKNGVFARFRQEFRRLILEEKCMNVIRGIDRNLTCLEALNMLEKAWNRVPADVVTKSFVTAGYDVQEPVESERIIPRVTNHDEEFMSNFLKDYDVQSYYTDLSNFDMYLTVDDELLTGQGTNCSVFGGNHKLIEPINCTERDMEEVLPLATEKPDSEDTEERIKKARALDDLDIVRKYLQSTDTSYEMFTAFMELDKFVSRDPSIF